MSVEWFQDIFRHQRFINAGIFVLAQLWQVALSNVHHLECI